MKNSPRTIAFLFCSLVCFALQAKNYVVNSPDGHLKARVSEQAGEHAFPMVDIHRNTASVCLSETDYPVVHICAQMLADDVERVTGRKPSVKEAASLSEIGKTPTIVVGTIGHSPLIDELIKQGCIDVSCIEGKWEASISATIRHPQTQQPMLVIAGSDRRGTAFGLTSLSRAIGVSPWYWWADVTPAHKQALYVEHGLFVQNEPSVQYRGIFINDERFGGWAHWVEQTLNPETHQVGPKVYKRVFELLLRLRANYLWPAMHPGTQAFNADPENARLADDYAIVMGSSHCEQMLRNNEGEWKAMGKGDFNYITNRKTMQDYWNTRVETNGQYENIYTLGLRGIHDYPMEGANSTEQRVTLMQQAMDDQRDILRNNIDRPLETIPQILCTYEEVLEAYHAGLKVPDDVTLLWSDDKQGYTRNLCNPLEMQRAGGAGIYYHLSYHGDPASWIWLSPLSPAFISNELSKAYRYGARKVWVFNVGDIKPAEKEISFAMDLAWDVERYAPERAHEYIKSWAAETFGSEYADEIAAMQAVYYRLMAGGKDAHVWFVEYTEDEIYNRLQAWQSIADRAETLRARIPTSLQDAYFELVLYPIRGAQMLNEYQLMSRLSMRHAALGEDRAIEEGKRVVALYDSLNEWTRYYNDEIQGGKWAHFFSWMPYHWYYDTSNPLPYCTPGMLAALRKAPTPREVRVSEALSAEGALLTSDCEGDIDLWIRAISPIRNGSKMPEDNVICRVNCGTQQFLASATPINNVWHSPLIGPMWSKVGTIHLSKGDNRLCLTGLSPKARIDSVYLGAYPPFPATPKQIIPAAEYTEKTNHDSTSISIIPGLGFTNGVTMQPLPMTSFSVEDAPNVAYDIQLEAGQNTIEIRTLPTLHLYEGRDARFAVQIDNQEPQIFSIHEGDFTPEWRKNVLRGYATRSVTTNIQKAGRHTLRIYLLDPGIVLQDIRIYYADSTPREQLLNRLKKIQQKGYMYGHQDDPFYGVTWAYEEGRSDTRDLVDDYPGIMGFDLGGLELADEKNLDSVPFELMCREIIRQHERGGIITLSWHPRNPYLGTTAWIENDLKSYDGHSSLNPKHTVASILPGGEAHEVFMLWLSRVRDFMSSLKDEKGQPIPFIFRPWHEYNGSWFWWGEGNCSPDEYKQLWNMTQDYLNAELPGQIVWANTPNLSRENTLEHFLQRWPGDERVDILGPDAYQWTADESQAERFRRNVTFELSFMAEYASQHGLLIALTECGCKNDVYPTWWTEVLHPAVENFPILYILTWRNYVKEHFGALPASTSSDNFVEYYHLPRTLFVKDIKKIQ